MVQITRTSLTWKAGQLKEGHTQHNYLQDPVTGQEVDIGFSSLKLLSLVWPGPSLPQLLIWLSQRRKEGEKLLYWCNEGSGFCYHWCGLSHSAFPALLKQRWSIGEGCTVGPGLVAGGLGCTWTVSMWHCGPPWWQLCSRGSSLLRSQTTDKYVGARAKQVFLSSFIFFICLSLLGS